MKYQYAIICLLGSVILFSAIGCGGGTIENQKPKISFVQPAGDDDGTDTSFILSWSASDPDDDASIALYYDTDNTGADGVLITSGISENSSVNYYVWDTSAVLPGTYYLYAVIDDAVNDPRVRYSGSIIVSHTPGDNMAPVITVTEPDGSDDISTTSFVIRWTDSDQDDDALISLYYDDDSSGNDGTLIVSGLSENSLSDSYTWDTSLMVVGFYYIYAVINDGVNAPVYDYGSGSVNIWDGSIEVGVADVQLNTDGVGTYISDQQQIASSGDKVYSVWRDYRNTLPDIYFNYSDDGGEIWGASDMLINRNSPGASSSLNPQICAEGDKVFIVWEDNRNGSKYDIYCNSSSDGGATWLTTDRRVDTHAAGSGDSRNPQICSSGNNIYITWQDYRNSRWEIYFNYSTDGGNTFQGTDFRVDSSDSANSQYPQISCSASNVYIIWKDNRSGANTDTFFNFVK